MVVILSLLTFVRAGFAEAMTMGAPDPSGMAMAMPSSSEAPMPCCPEKAPSCVTDVGCVFLVAIPMRHLNVSKAVARSAVRYQISHDRGEGLSIQPALGPPIPFA